MPALPRRPSIALCDGSRDDGGCGRGPALPGSAIGRIPSLSAISEGRGCSGRGPGTRPRRNPSLRGTGARAMAGCHRFGAEAESAGHRSARHRTKLAGRGLTADVRHARALGAEDVAGAGAARGGLSRKSMAGSQRRRTGVVGRRVRLAPVRRAPVRRAPLRQVPDRQVPARLAPARLAPTWQAAEGGRRDHQGAAVVNDRGHRPWLRPNISRNVPRSSTIAVIGRGYAPNISRQASRPSISIGGRGRECHDSAVIRNRWVSRETPCGARAPRPSSS